MGHIAFSHIYQTAPNIICVTATDNSEERLDLLLGHPRAVVLHHQQPLPGIEANVNLARRCIGIFNLTNNTGIISILDQFSQ